MSLNHVLLSIFIMAPFLIASFFLLPASLSALSGAASVGAFSLVCSLLVPDAAAELLVAALVFNVHRETYDISAFSWDAPAPFVALGVALFRALGASPGGLTPGRVLLLLASVSGLSQPLAENVVSALFAVIAQRYAPEEPLKRWLALADRVLGGALGGGGPAVAALTVALALTPSVGAQLQPLALTAVALAACGVLFRAKLLGGAAAVLPPLQQHVFGSGATRVRARRTPAPPPSHAHPLACACSTYPCTPPPPLPPPHPTPSTLPLPRRPSSSSSRSSAFRGPSSTCPCCSPPWRAFPAARACCRCRRCC